MRQIFFASSELTLLFVIVFLVSLVGLFLMELAADHASLSKFFSKAWWGSSGRAVAATRALHRVWVSVFFLYSLGSVLTVGVVLHYTGPSVFSPLGFAFVLDLPAFVLWCLLTAVLVLFVFTFVGWKNPRPALSNLSFFYFRYEELFIFFLLHVLSLFAFGCRDLLTLFICLEVATFAFFSLVGMPGGGSSRTHATSSSRLAEVGLRYLVPNLLASLLILLGILLLYYSLGQIQVSALLALLAGANSSASGLSAVALGLLCVGFLLKLGVAPFHSWMLWVYEAAPPHLVCFFSTFAKVFYSALFFKFVFPLLVHAPAASALFLVVGLFSILWASAFGLYELRLYPLLAYSGVLNAGYSLCAAALCSWVGAGIGFLVFLVYAFLLLGVFAVLIRTVSWGAGGYPMRAVFQLSRVATAGPLAPWALSVLVFALIGIPPLLGFYPKALIFFHLVFQVGGLAATLFLLGVVVSSFFYLRWVVCLSQGLSSLFLTRGVAGGVFLSVRASSYRSFLRAVGAVLGFLGLVGLTSLPATTDLLLALSQFALIISIG